LSLAHRHDLKSTEHIRSQMAVLQRRIDELCTEWMGVAPQTFATLMAEFDQHAKNIEATLDQIAHNLLTNHDVVVDTETTNIRLLTPHGTDATLRPARF
jgi:WXG100 family type VII secretion target